MISRRMFLKALITVAACYPVKNIFAYQEEDKILNMYNIHTKERLYTVYCSSGIYNQDAIDKINYFLRCHYTNKVKPIDIKVIDLLCDIKDFYGKNKEINIISGYRTHTYNEFLRKMGRHVSKNSLHIKGCAIDFTVVGVDNTKIADIAKSFKAGGVGRYPEFVHIDTGKLRYW